MHTKHSLSFFPFCQIYFSLRKSRNAFLFFNKDKYNKSTKPKKLILFYVHAKKDKITPASDLHWGYLSQHVHGRTLQVCNLITPKYIIAANQCIIIPTQRPKNHGPEIPSSSISCALSLLLCINHRHSSSTWGFHNPNHGGFFWLPNSRPSLFHPKLCFFFTVCWHWKFTEPGTERKFVYGFIAMGFHLLHSLTCWVFFWGVLYDYECDVTLIVCVCVCCWLVFGVINDAKYVH